MKKTVRVPECAEHQGIYAVEVTIDWTCPICSGPRGEVTKGISYDGSLRLEVDCWTNPCGHIDKYAAVREEAKGGAK